jgi:hypothetical protein
MVLHESDEREDDDRRPSSRVAGQLIGERLPAARGQDPERIPAGEHRLDELPLARTGSR